MKQSGTVTKVRKKHSVFFSHTTVQLVPWETSECGDSGWEMSMSSSTAGENTADALSGSRGVAGCELGRLHTDTQHL